MVTKGLIWIFLLTAIVLFISVLINKKTKTKKVLFFGDSLTEIGLQPAGYISVMKQMLQHQNIEYFELTGAGISGNTIVDLYERMHNDVISKDPDIVVLWIGVNDVWQAGLYDDGNSLIKFETLYRTVVNELLKHHYRIMLVTPAAIGEKRNNENPLDENINAYCSIIRNIAEVLKLPLCDLRAFFMLYANAHNKINASKGLLTIDGIHLNDTGNRLAAAEILRVLKEM
ncbi:MAG: G-D-S-L family lipolytic protein [Bacteroidetes bacterium]|nr:G-D-S-L family lipolytic protein [Bacteroidota bacterium]